MIDTRGRRNRGWRITAAQYRARIPVAIATATPAESGDAASTAYLERCAARLVADLAGGDMDANDSLQAQADLAALRRRIDLRQPLGGGER